jgi:hypothetical protein
MAERQLQRRVSPSEQALLTCGLLHVVHIVHIACQLSPLILSRLLHGPRQLLRLA